MQLDCKMEPSLPDIVEQDSPIRKAIAHTAPPPDSAMKATGREPSGPKMLRVSQTPRIDISRASSSSQHEDSRDSSPENVFEQVGTGTLQDSNDEAAADFGFGEYGANDLRSSTEELYFDDGDKAKAKAEQKEEREWQPPVSFDILLRIDWKCDRSAAVHAAAVHRLTNGSNVSTLICFLSCV